MIKMLCQVPRKQGLSEGEFYPRYLHGHGDLVRVHARAMGFLRYVQAHRIALPEIRLFTAENWRDPLDGQSELWWESWNSMERALASPEGTEASGILELDEQAFTDTVNVSGFVAQEIAILDRSDWLPPKAGTAVKIVIDMWKRPELGAADFSDRWRTGHARLVRQHASALGICKYVQNHRDPEAKFDFAELRGWQPAPDGVTEMWWPSVEAMTLALTTPEAATAIAALRTDEEAFSVPSLTRAFAAKEHTIFDFVESEPSPRY